MNRSYRTSREEKLKTERIQSNEGLVSLAHSGTYDKYLIQKCYEGQKGFSCVKFEEI